MKKLKNFLEKHHACDDNFEFAKDLTLEQFLSTCDRGDWILWLFSRTNKNDLQKLIEAKALCANTVRHLMKDKRSTKAIDVALAFASEKASKEELIIASAYATTAAYAAEDVAEAEAVYTSYAAYATAAAAFAAIAAAAASYAAADGAATAAYAAADAVYADYACYVAAAEAARKANRKLTADICRKILLLEIWNQSEF